MKTSSSNEQESPDEKNRQKSKVNIHGAMEVRK